MSFYVQQLHLAFFFIFYFARFAFDAVESTYVLNCLTCHPHHH